MRFHPPVEMAEVVSFHQRLCEQLGILESNVLAPEYPQSHPEHGQVRDRGLFKLRETFCNLFIVADHKAWREQWLAKTAPDVSSSFKLESEDFKINLHFKD